MREPAGATYFGERGRDGERPFDPGVYTGAEIGRTAGAGFEAAAGRLGVGPADVLEAIDRLEHNVKQLERQLEALKKKSARSKLDDLVEQARDVKGVRVVAARLSDVDRETMRELADVLRQKLGSGVIVLGSAEEGKVALVAAVTKDLVPKLHAGKMVQSLARLVGGSGGGRPDLAEAGGKNPEKLNELLAAVPAIIDKML